MLKKKMLVRPTPAHILSCVVALVCCSLRMRNMLAWELSRNIQCRFLTAPALQHQSASVSVPADAEAVSIDAVQLLLPSLWTTHVEFIYNLKLLQGTTRRFFFSLRRLQAHNIVVAVLVVGKLMVVWNSVNKQHQHHLPQHWHNMKYL